jgi:hypothetical protein
MKWSGLFNLRLEKDVMSVSPGRYRHYKGNDYTVLGVAKHSENEEELVIYRQEYGDHALWARPLAMFQELVRVGGQEVPRFRLLPTDLDSSRSAH